MDLRMIDALGAFGGFRYRIENPGQPVEDGVVPNIYTHEGLLYAWGAALGGVTPITLWYLGLKDNTGDPPVATRTYAAPGFVEYAGYYEGDRQLWDLQAITESDGVISAHNDDESPGHDSWAVFTFDEDQDIYGFVQYGGGTDASVAGDTAGGGTILRFANFASVKEMKNGGTLKVMAEACIINTSPPA